MPRDKRAYLADIVESCVDFRNQLTHEYPTVDDALVWAILENDVPALWRECAALLESAGASEEG